MKKLLPILIVAFATISCKKQTGTSNQLKKDFTAVKDSLTATLKTANKDGEIVEVAW